jgi:hypothetical protein
MLIASAEVNDETRNPTTAHTRSRRSSEFTQGVESKAEGNPRAVLGPALRLAMWKRKRSEPG